GKPGGRNCGGCEPRAQPRERVRMRAGTDGDDRDVIAHRAFLLRLRVAPREALTLWPYRYLLVSELAAKLVRSIAADNASRDNSGAGFSPSGGQREKIIRDRGGRGCRGSDSDLDVSGELCRDREDRHSVAAHGQCRSRRASLQSGGGSRRRHRQQQAMKKQGKKIASIAVVNEN